MGELMKARAVFGIVAALGMGVASLSLPTPAIAMQSQPSLAADDCVFYREDGSGGYHLTNTCDYAIAIAFCAQPKSDPGLCLRSQSWTRETLTAKGEGKSKVFPDQALDLFACRAPGSVEILPSGMARCNGMPPEPVIPTLLSASLKNPGGIITDRDYPPSEHDKEGTTRFDLMVGPDGKPLSCTTTLSSGHEVLDRTACNAFLKRARFSPAKDANGVPTTGRYKGSVTWKAP
jgi:TonB family protein